MKKILIATSILILILIGVSGFYLLHINGLSIKSSPLPDLSSLGTAKLAQIPDDYYNSMIIGGGVTNSMSGIAFNPNGKEVAYVVKKNNKSSVYINNTPRAWYDSIEGGAYSSGGEHYYYSAKNGKDSFIVLDGKELKHYYQNAYINDYESAIGSTGIVAYVVNYYGTTTMVFNEHVGNSYDSIFDSKISPDGQSVVYYGCNDDLHVVSDINPSGYCQFVTQNAGGSSNEAWGLMYSYGVRDAIYKAQEQYSPDGKILAYTNDLGVMVGGIQLYPPGGATHTNIESLIFSPDSKHLAYVAQDCGNVICTTDGGDVTGGKWYVVMDNSTTTNSTYDEIGNLVFNNEDNVAYFARSGSTWSLVINGKTVTQVPSDNNGKNSLFGPVFSADDSHYLYTYMDTGSKNVLIEDGNEVARADNIVLPQFTPTGKIIYMYMSGDKKIVKMGININGVAQTTHDLVVPFFSLPTSIYSSFYQFTSNSKIVYGAIDGKDIDRIVEPIK
jgi:hypothetical protein